MTARARVRVGRFRHHIDTIASDAALAHASSAASSALAPYALQEGKARDLIFRAAYKAAYSAAYKEAAREALHALVLERLPNDSGWSTVAVDAAVAAASRVHAAAMLRQFARRSIATWSLGTFARILPATARERWQREWIGEISTLTGRKAQSRYAWQTLRGLPELAWTLWLPSTGRQQ